MRDASSYLRWRICRNGLPHSAECGLRRAPKRAIGFSEMSSWSAKPLRKSISLPHLGREKPAQKMLGNGPIEFGAHGRTRTAGLLLTKEVLNDHFPIGAPLRSNPAAIANNRCLAALPRKSIRRAEITRGLRWQKALWCHSGVGHCGQPSGHIAAGLTVPNRHGGRSSPVLPVPPISSCTQLPMSAARC